MAHENGNEQADKIVSFDIPKEQHALLYNNAGSYAAQFQKNLTQSKNGPKN